MSQRILFTCDRCKQEWDQSSPDCPQPVNLNLTLSCGNHQPATQYEPSALVRNQTWCRPCVEAAGVILRKKPSNSLEKLKAPEPSTEDILVDLLVSLGFTRE